MTTSLEHIDRIIGEIDGEMSELPPPPTYYKVRDTLRIELDLLESLAERMSPMYDYDAQVWHVYRRGEGLTTSGPADDNEVVGNLLASGFKHMGGEHLVASAWIDALSPHPTNEELFGGDLHQRDGMSE